MRGRGGSGVNGLDTSGDIARRGSGQASPRSFTAKWIWELLTERSCFLEAFQTLNHCSYRCAIDAREQFRGSLLETFELLFAHVRHLCELRTNNRDPGALPGHTHLHERGHTEAQACG